MVSVYGFFALQEIGYKKGRNNEERKWALPKSFLEVQLVKKVAIISFHWAPL